MHTNTLLQTNWRDQWLGGFCSVGALGGLPVRGPDYAAHPPLEQTFLPPKAAGEQQLTSPFLPASPHCTWTAVLGKPIVLAKNVAVARSALLTVAGVQPGEPVVLPPNAPRSLVEAIKAHGASPQFAPLDNNLNLQARQLDAPLAWGVPVAGLPTTVHFDGPICLDYTTTIPSGGAITADMLLFGLHLTYEQHTAGAMIVCRDDSLAWRLRQLLGAASEPDATQTESQCLRLGTLAYAQKINLAETWRGLQEAVGLPLLPLHETGALPHGVALQIPAEMDVATFYAYVTAENTPIRWLPHLQPVHYAAFRHTNRSIAQETAENLSRWLLVPVGPTYTEEEVKHAILGVAKTADYLGLRWYTTPPKAADYAAMMTELYGEGHDAFQPIFLF